MNAAAPILQVRELQKQFELRGGLLSRVRGRLHAVDGISFSVAPGETLGIVGESGCGKSTTGRLILRLIEPTSGSIQFEEQELVGLKPSPLLRLRRHMQMVFQDPYSSLNPRLSVADTIRYHLSAQGVERRLIHDKTLVALQRVGLQAKYGFRLPHEMSGGQRQRVNIARAISNNPKLLIADEPVSALDKSVQAQVLNLLQELKSGLNLTLIFISHDLNVVRYLSDTVAVMYLGRIVEMGPANEIYRRPLHPYSRALIASVPSTRPSQRGRVAALQGDIPSPLQIPTGCRFRTRCPIAMPICETIDPALQPVGDGREVACHNVQPGAIDEREVPEASVASQGSR
jgi:oligopeptide/dipeptide ABC transporter ATP-binding protein